MVHIGHASSHVASADAVVTSTAIKPDNPEVVAARERNVPVVPRAIMLAELLRLRQGIAIAGTHGKTTTTSLVASILAEAGMDPTFVIGGQAGSGRLACQARPWRIYRSGGRRVRRLVSLSAARTGGGNQYRCGSHGDLRSRFHQAQAGVRGFRAASAFYGMAVLCVDDASVREIMPAITKPITTYGLSDTAQVRAARYSP